MLAGNNNMNSDMTKTQVESLLNSALDHPREFKDRLFDDFLSKLKTEFDSEANTPSTEEPPPVSATYNAQYQATVEDETASQAEMPTPMTERESHHRMPSSTQESPTHTGSTVSRCSTPASSVSSDSSKSPSRSSPRRRPESILVKPTASGSPANSPQPSPRPRPTVHFSDRPAVILHNPSEPVLPRGSPTAPARIVPSDLAKKDVVLSAVDQKWGRLFDDMGEPTNRLGQFLRGIANYMIAEYNPVKSLVVTPEKLYAFYGQFKLSSEVFPFRRIFDTRSSNSLQNLEYLYRDLQCEYHLIQGKPHSKPRVPALTPKGFEDWMLQHIRAFPEQEARRLNRVIAELPISTDGPGADGKPERLPKQLSRHLLPEKHSIKVHEAVVASVTQWVKDAGLAELPSTKQAPAENVSKSTSKPTTSVESKDHAVCRYKVEEKTPSDSSSSRRRHKSRDRHTKVYDRGSARVESASRHLSRASSEGHVKHEQGAAPAPTSHHRSRTPVSVTRYRHSVPVVGTESDSKYGLSSSSQATHHGSNAPSAHTSYPKTNSGDYHSREQDYRPYPPRSSHSISESTPRSHGRDSKRQSLVLALPADKGLGYTYEEYMRLSPKANRTFNLGKDSH